MLKTMNIGIDHGYYAIKTRHFSFPAGIAVYSHEPYTLQNTLEYGGKFYVCGTGRQPILRNKTENDNYYLLTLAAIAREIKQRGENTECSVTLAAGLPLAGFGREKKFFREYLLRSSQPVCFKFEGVPYKITIEDVKLFPQGYSAIAIHPELIQNEPSVLLKMTSRPQKGRFRQQSEYIVWGSNGPMPVSRPVGCLPGVFRYANPQNRTHVTEKPLQLMRDLVKICEPGGRILDPFCGAGTTVLASRLEGYEAVGIEVTDAYYKLGSDRVRFALESHAE